MTGPGLLRRRLRLAAAWVLLASGALGLILGDRHFALRALGILAIFVAIYLSRRSDAGRSVAGISDSSYPSVTPRFWVVGVILTVATLGCYYALYRDSARGSNEVWPVYAFAASCVALALWAATLAAKYSK